MTVESELPSPEGKQPRNVRKALAAAGLGIVVLGAIYFAATHHGGQPSENNATSSADTPDAPNPNWDPSLTDYNGLWQSPSGGLIRIWFSPEASGISYPDADELIEIEDVDKNSGDVLFTETPTTMAMVALDHQLEKAAKGMGATLPEQIYTLRRDWDEQHKAFTIVLIRPEGLSTSYGFIRKLTAKEQAAFSDIQSRAASALQQYEKSKTAGSSPPIQSNEATPTPGSESTEGVDGDIPPGAAKADGYYDEQNSDKPDERPTPPGSQNK